MIQVARLENSKPALKQCNDCHQWFEKTAFPPGRARCKKCHPKRQSVSRRKTKLKRKYRITPEIYQAMCENQGGKCYFCDHRPSEEKEKLAIDHDKDTGFVRGLLCRPCNAGWVDEYKNRVPREYQDSQRTNDYLRRGETGAYVESIKLRLASRPASQLRAASS